MLSYCNSGGASYEKIKQEKEDWLKSLHLEEDKISIIILHIQFRKITQ
nr:MAG TPA: hypothetical protein [Bacteriophage sp.]